MKYSGLLLRNETQQRNVPPLHVRKAPLRGSQEILVYGLSLETQLTGELSYFTARGSTEGRLTMIPTSILQFLLFQSMSRSI